ncbi:MAG TPA: hypothetical protein VIX63_09470 [Vicinamibacterales bacterium]
MRIICLLIVCVAVLAATGIEAIELALGPRALTEALDVGLTRIDSIRTRFHQPYRLPVLRPPVDYAEIITPFRRVVLAAESRARAGDRLFGQREARATLGDTPEQVDVLVELTFHPQNTFIGLPAYVVRLLPVQAATGPVEPRDFSHVPRFGPRINGASPAYPYAVAPPVAPGAQPLTGGAIIARLDGRILDSNGLYDLVVLDGGKELARARLDLRALR